MNHNLSGLAEIFGAYQRIFLTKSVNLIGDGTISQGIVNVPSLVFRIVVFHKKSAKLTDYRTSCLVLTSKRVPEEFVTPFERVDCWSNTVIFPVKTMDV